MPPRDEDFKQRFDSILLDMRISGSTDAETMWLVGSLAARLIDQGRPIPVFGGMVPRCRNQRLVSVSGVSSSDWICITPAPRSGKS